MEIKTKIQNLIDENDVCLFMKGTPDSPQCGFSMAVSNILKHLKINFKGVDVLQDQNIRQGIKEFSDWPTIPQLYVRGEFIGGCDIVKEMFEKGELKKIFKTKEFNLEDYIYKTLIAVIALIVVFEFTIGKTLNKITKQTDILLTKEGRNKW